MDGVLLAAVGLAAGAALALAPLPCALSAVAAASLLAVRGARSRGRAARGTLREPASAWHRWFALGLLALGGLRASVELDAAEQAYRRSAALLPSPARCELDAEVVRSPVVVRHGVVSSRASEGYVGRIDVDLRHGRCEGRVLSAPLRVRLYGAPSGLTRGDRLELVADIGPVNLYRNPGSPDPRARVALSGVTASGGVVLAERVARGRGPGRWIDEARNAVRRRIEASFAADVAPMARALVLGETDLRDADRQAFRHSGLAHLLAVSGTHLVLVVVALCKALRAVLTRIELLAAGCDVGRLSAALCLPLCWLYADFAGGEGSAYRAAAMLGLGLAARAAGRRPSAVRCFALSLLLGAAVEPLAMCNLSFALSVGATAGLLLAHRPVVERLRGRSWPVRALGSALWLTTAAMAGCAPILLLIGPSLPVMGVVANVIAAPVGELAALPLCLAHALVWWAPSVERGVAIVASGALELVRAVAYASSGPDGWLLELPTPTGEQLGVVAIGAVALWRCRRLRPRLVAVVLALAALGALELVATDKGRPRGELHVHALDVAQGDALLVDLPDGRAMLIDGGGMLGSPVDLGERVLLPVLRARRRHRLDVVVVTHPHPDHYLGLIGALKHVEVGELWLSGQALVPAAGAVPSRYQKWVASLVERGVSLRLPAELCSAPRAFGRATVRVLAPCPAHDPKLGANDNSLVLRLDYGRRAVLLMGDAERERERRLLAEHPVGLRVDLLKVGHHGSRSSTTAELIGATAPSHALISCGVRNRFGHPAPQTLSRLARGGVQPWRTDRGGTIHWHTDGEQMWLEQAGGALLP